MGCPAPSFMLVSMSRAVASPLSSIRIASIMVGTSNLLTIKPGVSWQETVVFPRAAPHSCILAMVSSLVSGVLTTSKSFITGTGLKKCSPPKRSFLEVLLAISDIGNEEVLLANMVEGPAALSKEANSFFFTSRFSTMASTTRSTFFTASLGSVLNKIPDTAFRTNSSPAFLSSANFFFETRLRLSSMRPLDFSKTSCDTSTSTTWWPACAATWKTLARVHQP
uniref:Uncharacterized protein n=1 Tax=Ixodes ricinus TaxID=34613 RepID=A0A6B0V3E8_IXORI